MILAQPSLKLQQARIFEAMQWPCPSDKVGRPARIMKEIWYRECRSGERNCRCRCAELIPECHSTTDIEEELSKKLFDRAVCQTASCDSTMSYMMVCDTTALVLGTSTNIGCTKICDA